MDPLHTSPGVHDCCSRPVQNTTCHFSTGGCDNALYKFIFDIDTGIEVTPTGNLVD